jgi:hypothetical protein
MLIPALPVLYCTCSHGSCHLFDGYGLLVWCKPQTYAVQTGSESVDDRLFFFVPARISRAADGSSTFAAVASAMRRRSKMQKYSSTAVVYEYCT